MEGRVPPAGDASDDPPLSQPPPPFRSGTYVVQVPKDQIYRVPPPQNASIVARHRNPARQKRSCGSCLLWMFIFIVIVALILAILLGTIYLVVQPKSPKFSVQHALVKNLQSLHHHPQYHISFKAQNPNEMMGISYQGGGHVSLYFKQKQIATGKPPTFYQEHEDSKIFRVVLAGRNVKLPGEIRGKSMKGKKSKAHISFSLAMHAPVVMKIGLLRTWTMEMAVSCDFRVNTLAKGAHILSQKCHTNVQL